MTPAPPPPDPSDPGITSSNPDGTASWRPTPPRSAAERGPRTASGQTFASRIFGLTGIFVEADILAIEAEAGATAALPLDVALDVLNRDSHHWSKRPCVTCAAITKALNKPFGCDWLRLSAGEGGTT